jgi:pimeloyl-ACP methyl ester carboxylesterase
MNSPSKRPRLLHTAMDFTALLPRRPINHRSLNGVPPGDGGAVLVLPGIGHDDRQTARFRDGLKMLEYTPFGWELGRNWGPTARLMEGVGVRLARLAREHGSVRVVGFSMGGLFARFLAQSKPHLVRQVVTVCSPFGDPLHSAWFSVRPALPFWRDVDIGTLTYVVRLRPEMPWLAVYSRIDGVVGWRACLDETAPLNCVEVHVRHRQAMAETEVFAAVGRFLATGNVAAV